jgi:hypothetical protein
MVGAIAVSVPYPLNYNPPFLRRPQLPQPVRGHVRACSNTGGVRADAGLSHADHLNRASAFKPADHALRHTGCTAPRGRSGGGGNGVVWGHSVAPVRDLAERRLGLITCDPVGQRGDVPRTRATCRYSRGPRDQSTAAPALTPELQPIEVPTRLERVKTGHSSHRASEAASDT